MVRLGRNADFRFLQITDCRLEGSLNQEPTFLSTEDFQSERKTLSDVRSTQLRPHISRSVEWGLMLLRLLFSSKRQEGPLYDSVIRLS